jgi:hypothetical protein
MEKFPYNDNDSVLVGWEGPIHAPGSVEQTCHICKRKVWCSPASLNTVLDAKNEQGGKVYISCIYCVDPERLNDLQLSPLQMEECRKAGLDIEELSRKTGKTVSQLMAEAIKFFRLTNALQRAAKKEGEQ